MNTKKNITAMPKGRKGSAGGLAVLGALLIVVFYILLSLSKEGSPASKPVNYQVLTGFNHTIEGAQQFVDLCLKRSATYNLLLYGRRGGVMALTDPFLPTSKTSILLDGDKLTAPSQESARLTLAEAVASGMEQCLAGFGSFKSRGFTISDEGEAGSRVSITPDSIEFHYSKPFTISKGKSKKTYQNFEYTIAARLSDMIGAARKILEFSKDRPEDADLTPLMGSGLEIVFFGSDGAGVVVIRDPDHNVDGAPYEFWMGIKK